MPQFVEQEQRKRGEFLSLSPLLLFLCMYVVVSIVIGDFYKMPIAVALLVASIWAIMLSRRPGIKEKIDVFSRGAGNSNIMYMIWIFVLAGAFATLAQSIGAVDATVALTMKWLPARFFIPGIFVASCFISMAIGTSVGTVVALTPLAATFASNVGVDVAYMVAVVIGGAFFGDNLSFISDTTIAATRTQGCRMNEKFKANVKLALPAAAITLLIYLFDQSDFTYTSSTAVDFDMVLVVPYLTVIVLAIAGINVTVTLLSGIVLAVAVGLWHDIGIMDIFGIIGTGVDNMGNLIIITLLASGMLAMIADNGGLDYLLHALTRHVKSRRGAQGAICSLVGVVNLCTANNTVAILTVGSISKDISSTYGIPARKSASLLDTASCVVQCLIPYGAQTLLATSLAGIAPTSPWPYLYYPWILLLTMFISILAKKVKI